MSRGISLDVALKDELGELTIYEVQASGWIAASPNEVVGIVKIDSGSEIISFEPEGAWEGEFFALPTWKGLVNLSQESYETLSINESFKMWNFLLIKALNRVITMPECKKRVFFHI